VAAELERRTALAAEILQGHRAVAGLLEAAADPEAREDLRAQLTALVPPDFLDAIPRARLAHLPRYLEAMRRRLVRLAENPARDRRLRAELAPLVAEWRRLCPEAREVGECEALRWLLEELRVSLFAQELGTAEPVSGKRLRERLARLAGR
jgi:ATP-dependent helicase HrpA